jgi:SAM-dependent methyltransferase
MTTFTAVPDFAELFERLLVPAHFAPWAGDLIERARPIGPSSRVLDLGCGTGIVARLLRERLGGAARLTGLDVNAGLLGVARRVVPELDWHEGNAMSLPFPNGAFDLVLSQQMLQFVPDRAKAVREIRRVLAPGGRLVVSTWRPRSFQPLFEALGKSAESHLGGSNDKRWSLDGDELRVLLVEAGFDRVTIAQLTLLEQYREFPVRASAMAANFDLASLPDDERERRLTAVEKDGAEILRRFATADGLYAAPSVTNIATAVAH